MSSRSILQSQRDDNLLDDLQVSLFVHGSRGIDQSHCVAGFKRRGFTGEALCPNARMSVETRAARAAIPEFLKNVRRLRL